MEIASVIVCMLLFNLVSGCLEIGIWKVTVKVLMRKVHFEPICMLMVMGIVIWVIPADFAVYIVWLVRKYLFFGEGVAPYEMAVLGRFTIVTCALFLIWVLAACQNTIHLRRYNMLLRQKARSGRPLPDRMQFIYEQEYKRLNIKERVKIQSNHFVDAPYVFYDRGCYYIQFPEGEIADEAFRAACRHELYHVLHKDPRNGRILARVSCFIPMLHQPNFSNKDLDMWIEINRDIEVLAWGDIDPDAYYGYLIDYAGKDTKEKEAACGGTNYFGKHHQNRLIYRREIVMEHFRGKKKALRGMGLVLLIGIFMTATATAVFAGVEVTRRGALRAYELTMEKEKLVQPEEEPGVEYTCVTTETPSAIMDLNPMARMANLTWTVPSDDRLESKLIHIEAGQKLTISGLGDPSTISFRFGYTDRRTDHYCVCNGGEFGYTFTIAETGDYRIFIRNLALFKSLRIGFYYNIE